MAAPDIAVHAARRRARRRRRRPADHPAGRPAGRRRASRKIVLTGGGVGIAMLEQIRATVARDAVDWGARGVLLGRRAVPAARRPRAQRDPGPRGAARPRRASTRRKVFPMGADTGTGPSGARGRRRGVRGAAAPRRPPGGPRPGALVRRAAAGHGRRGPHRVGLPALPRGATRPSARWSPCTAARSRRRPGCRSPCRRSAAPPRSWIVTTGDGEGRRGGRWRWAGPARWRSRWPGPPAAGAPAGCSTARPRPSCRATSSRRSPDRPSTSAALHVVVDGANVVGSRPTAGGATGRAPPTGSPASWSPLLSTDTVGARRGAGPARRTARCRCTWSWRARPPACDDLPTHALLDVVRAGATATRRSSSSCGAWAGGPARRHRRPGPAGPGGGGGGAHHRAGQPAGRPPRTRPAPCAGFRPVGAPRARPTARRPAPRGAAAGWSTPRWW